MTSPTPNSASWVDSSDSVRLSHRIGPPYRTDVRSARNWGAPIREGYPVDECYCPQQRQAPLPPGYWTGTPATRPWPRPWGTRTGAAGLSPGKDAAGRGVGAGRAGHPGWPVADLA